MKILILALILFVLILLPVASYAASFSRDLYFGLRNDEEVKLLQEFLRDRALFGGPVTGNFFSLTREAVIRFQKEQNISPAAGYFGPISQGKANEILAGQITANDPVAVLVAKIKELQEKLALLVASQNTGTTTAPAPPPPPPPSTPPLTFSKNPFVSEKGFVGTEGQFGVRHPYRTILDWELNSANATTTVSCEPGVKMAVPPAQAKAEIYPHSDTAHSCKVTADVAGAGAVSSTVSFTAPAWVSAGGYATSSFPEVETTSFKMGEISLYNGRATDVVFGELQTYISDEMDSLNNRNHKVNFLLRDGHEATDGLISKTSFTFVATAPKVGEPYVASLNLPFGATLKAGEERVYSLWIEQLKFVRSGTLKITINALPTTDASVSVVAGFRLVLTKEPPL